MKIIAAACVALIAAQAARAENKPFNVRNGKAVHTTPAAAPSRLNLLPAGAASGAAANMADPGSDVAMASPSGGGAFFGGGASRSFTPRPIRGARRSGAAFWSRNRRVEGGGNIPAPTTPAPAAEEETPAHFKTPGALIRTAGQQPKYAEAEAARQHTVPAGEIAFNPARGYDVGRSRGVFIGPADTLPPPNPGTSGRTYTSGAGSNSGPSSGNGSGNTGNGGNNNGSGNNDKDKPGDDDDGHGGSKKAGADPTGFYSAF